MATSKKTRVKSLTAASLENTIRNRMEAGYLKLSAAFMGLGRHTCKLDNTWSIHGVTLKKDVLSFVASQKEQRPIKFTLSRSFDVEKAVRWFQRIAKKLTTGTRSLKNAIIPLSIVFEAGITEHYAEGYKLEDCNSKQVTENSVTFLFFMADMF